jgi:hypothetical protein
MTGVPVCQLLAKMGAAGRGDVAAIAHRLAPRDDPAAALVPLGWDVDQTWTNPRCSCCRLGRWLG